MIVGPCTASELNFESSVATDATHLITVSESKVTECKQSVYEESELSIFDDIRHDLLAAFEGEHSGRSDSSYVAFIAGQKAKISN